MASLVLFFRDRSGFAYRSYAKLKLFFKKCVPRYIRRKTRKTIRRFVMAIIKNRNKESNYFNDNLSTYIVPTEWWEKNSKVRRLILLTQRPVLVIGECNPTPGTNMTVVTNPRMKDFFLSSIFTKTAVEILPHPASSFSSSMEWRKLELLVKNVAKTNIGETNDSIRILSNRDITNICTKKEGML